MPPARALVITLCAAALATGGGCGDSGPTSYGDSVTDPELPARGSDDVTAWLAAGLYESWNCEPEAHPARGFSPHGANRICSNAALVASTGPGPYPVGAAAVKEIFDEAGAIRLFAVYRKVTAGEGGDTWYWYEGKGDDVVANGEGDDTCTGCHGRAERDFVFTVVP